jgi:hypothetical protein
MAAVQPEPWLRALITTNNNNNNNNKCSPLLGIATQHPGFAGLSLVPTHRVYFDGICVLQNKDQGQA